MQKNNCFMYPYNVVNTIVQVASGNPIQSKWQDSTCYCSQFVWRSWCAANIGFDFSGANPWILPVDFQLTSQTKKIASYKNKQEKNSDRIGRCIADFITNSYEYSFKELCL